MSPEEGDRIARMVLQLVKAIRDESQTAQPLDRNGPSPVYNEFERLTGAA